MKRKPFAIRKRFHPCKVLATTRRVNELATPRGISGSVALWHCVAGVDKWNPKPEKVAVARVALLTVLDSDKRLPLRGVPIFEAKITIGTKWFNLGLTNKSQLFQR